MFRSNNCQSQQYKIFLVPSVASQLYSMLTIEMLLLLKKKKVIGSTAVEFQAEQ